MFCDNDKTSVFLFFRQPEIYSAVTVGWEAHPTSTCGAFGGLETHPTAFLFSFSGCLKMC
ncbi:MAG: hypothetical protein IKZ88_09250 [Neisseriaceae bacterium]|nr:hypothetical protein [Neisseriaceae bacterium]